MIAAVKEDAGETPAAEQRSKIPPPKPPRLQKPTVPEKPPRLQKADITGKTTGKGPILCGAKGAGKSLA